MCNWSTFHRFFLVNATVRWTSTASRMQVLILHIRRDCKRVMPTGGGVQILSHKTSRDSALCTSPALSRPQVSNGVRSRQNVTPTVGEVSGGGLERNSEDLFGHPRRSPALSADLEQDRVRHETSHPPSHHHCTTASTDTTQKWAFETLSLD